MKRALLCRQVIVAIALGCCAFLGAALAAEPVIEFAGAIPESIAPSSLRAALSSDGLKVKIGETTLAEVWVATEVAAAPEGRTKPGANYLSIADGALLAVIRFDDRWSDYRGRSVPAGSYTLRYAVQPVDGDHMGVSEFLDYAVLVPAAKDLDPKPVGDRKALYALSREASGRNHPAILYLVPPGKAAAPSVAAPSVDTLTLVAAPGGRAMGFVLRGRTDSEGS